MSQINTVQVNSVYTEQKCAYLRANCYYFKGNNLQPFALVSSEMQIRQVNIFSFEANETISGESC